MTGKLDPASLQEQAQAMLSQNKLQPAKALYARICEMDGDDAMAWHRLGVVNARLGKMDEAEAAWRRAVTLKPDFAAGHCNLANTLFCLGRRQEAVDHYRDALRLQPDYAEALNNMGTALSELDRLEEAAQCYETVLGLAPSAVLHYNLANVRTQQRRLKEAVHHYRQALALDSERPEIHNNLGNALRHLGRHPDAEASYRRALALGPDHPAAHEAHANLGAALLNQNRDQEALVCYTRALELKPDFLRAVAGQASILEKQGKFEQAYALLEPYLAADKEDAAMAVTFASISRPLGRREEAIRRLERILAAGGPGMNVYDRILLHYNLGRLLDAAGRYESAFDHIRRANELTARRFDVHAQALAIDAHINTCDRAFMDRAPRAATRSDRPVFIVGMPRSGTSLVEQILASHPAVHGAGELGTVYDMVTELPAFLQAVTPYPRCLEALTPDHCERLARRYLDHIDGLAPAHALRVTDKMPANFLHLGLISLLFPEARVIHCVRDPLDTCLSCYFLHFTWGHDYAYDLEHLGFYYRQYQRLMNHWRSVLQIPMMEVRYEELVADQEGVSRAMVEFCGLPWDERCLRFHENHRLVRTASYDQVRQPLYNRSVGRWHHYERHLEPLRRALSRPLEEEGAARPGTKEADGAAPPSPPEDVRQRALMSLEAGQLNEARSLYSEACRLAPDDGDAWFMLGTLNGRLGLAAEAERCLRRALELQPRRPEAHFNLGRALEDQGRGEQAIAHYGEAARLRPEFAAAHARLGSLLQAQGRHDEAVNSLRDAVLLSPNMAQAHHNLGNALMSAGRHAEAIAAYRRAILLQPDLAETHNNLGLALTERHLFGEAEAAYREALRLRPDSADTHHNLGNLLNRTGRYAGAAAAYREALRHDPDHVEVLDNLGLALLTAGELEEAKQCYQRALSLDPANRRAAAGAAAVLERQGEHAQAYGMLQPFLGADQDDAFLVMVFAAACRPLGHHDEAIAVIERLLQRGTPLSEEHRGTLSVELGRLYDDKGKYDTAFIHFQRGNDIKARIWPFDPQAHCRRVETLMATFSRDLMARAPRATVASRRPVFIVGMPRSGTSLVEQILASHPEVFGAGELDEMDRIVAGLPAAVGSPTPYPHIIAEMTSGHCDRLAQRYLDRIAGLTGPGARCITDKMPTNFFHLGLIALLFPEARIIHCLRDPLDTCVSCYFQSFPPGLSWTYDLEHLGVFYRYYRRLMTHWRKMLDTAIMEVRYEDLVTDQERLSRALVEFCGLEWDERCLRFHETSRAVATASYDQVHQPLYGRSVGRWRHYERHLAPLRQAALGEHSPGP